MNKYKVTITEILKRTVEIEAENEEIAEETVREQYDRHEIILECEDYHDTFFETTAT